MNRESHPTGNRNPEFSCATAQSEIDLEAVGLLWWFTASYDCFQPTYLPIAI